MCYLGLSLLHISKEHPACQAQSQGEIFQHIFSPHFLLGLTVWHHQTWVICKNAEIWKWPNTAGDELYTTCSPLRTSQDRSKISSSSSSHLQPRPGSAAGADAQRAGEAAEQPCSHLLTSLCRSPALSSCMLAMGKTPSIWIKMQWQLCSGLALTLPTPGMQHLRQSVAYLWLTQCLTQETNAPLFIPFFLSRLLVYLLCHFKAIHLLFAQIWTQSH